VDRPGDIDGYFHCDLRDWASGKLERRLNQKASKPIWGWDIGRGSGNERGHRKLPMWHEYRVELWPTPPPPLGHTQFSGLRDRRGRDLSWIEAFRQTRQGRGPRGMIRIEASHDSQ
jgi:hypothetical protein